MSRLVMWFLAALIGVSSARADDPLWEHFQTPPAEARPMVRWWWNGTAPSAQELSRQLDTLQQAGLGGVEICPTALPPGAQDPPAKSLKWLSPEWCQLLKTASAAAAQRQMLVDLVAGDGQPWGGEFVIPEHAAQRVDLVTRQVKGPAKLTLTRDEFLTPPPAPEGTEPKKVAVPELLFLRLVPIGCKSPEDAIDLLALFDEQGNLTTKVPKGEFTLCAGLLRKDGQWGSLSETPNRVSERRDHMPVLDHYNRDAVRSFLDQISGSVRTNLKDDLGKFVQTVACDDVNLSGANWTGDIADEFKRRCGYELGPYLPFVVDFNQKLPVSKEFAPLVARARHDFAKTLAELFRERFVDTFHDWCREQGTKSRVQIGGGDWLPGLAEIQLLPDVPQGSSPLIVDRANHSSAVWSKYASSGGHLADRRAISSRAMANSRGVFQENLNQIKAAGDFDFLTGINHTALSGFNHSPRNAGFPGWVQSGTYFSPNSTWWPSLPQWNAYQARLAAVFQASRPVTQVAILAPTADVWSESGLSSEQFHKTPWYVHQLWQSLSQQGCSADYVCQRTLQKAKCENGKLCCGPLKYDALVVVDARSLAPATTSALVLYADSGGRLAFVGRKPDRSSGLNNTEQRDQAVGQAMQHLKDGKKATVVEIAPPAKQAELLAWTANLIKTLGVPRSVAFDKPSRDLQQVHNRHDNRDIFFLANTSGERSVATTANFAAEGNHAWQWNPETGRRAVYPTEDNRARIHLGPHESMLLVFETAEPPADAPRVAPPIDAWQEALAIAEQWSGELVPIEGKRFAFREMPLGELGKSPDPRLQNFAGTVVYRTQFELPEVPAGPVVIDLGKVHDISEVQLNGEPLGSVWYGSHRFDATGRLSAGENTLEVRVATPLFNYTQSLKDNPTAKFWTERAAKKELVPAGLVGPVRLMTPVIPDATKKDETADKR